MEGALGAIRKQIRKQIFRDHSYKSVLQKLPYYCKQLDLGNVQVLRGKKQTTLDVHVSIWLMHALDHKNRIHSTVIGKWPVILTVENVKGKEEKVCLDFVRPPV